MGILNGLQIHSRLISIVCASCNSFNIRVLISEAALNVRVQSPAIL
jgi:hypothetical protein